MVVASQQIEVLAERRQVGDVVSLEDIAVHPASGRTGGSGGARLLDPEAGRRSLAPMAEQPPGGDRRRRFTLVGLSILTMGALVGAYLADGRATSEVGVATAAAADLALGEGEAGGEGVGSGPTGGDLADATEDPTTTTTSLPERPTVVAATTVLEQVDRITGDISPKSVVASGAGLVFAQNMMYTHSVTAYRADGSLAATIDDSVDLADFGIPGHPGTVRGAPVEAAFTSDGRYAYVSNYSMYGTGFGPEGSDSCTPDSGYDDSYVYRVDTGTMAIDQVIRVGAVPKYVAVSPDDATVLVTNWCTYDLSVIDVATAREVRRIPIGRYPRGVVVAPDSTTAYVAVMGGGSVVRVDLASGDVQTLVSAGESPRHLLISPDGGALFISHNRSHTVVRVDLGTGSVTHSVSTGQQPRSMAISADGSAIYVANYESSTVSKLRADDLTQIDSVPTDHHPIGITYEPTTGTVWVACYGGSILVYDDTVPGPPT